MPVGAGGGARVARRKTVATTATLSAGDPGGVPNPPSGEGEAAGLLSWLPTDGPNPRAFITDAGKVLVRRLAANAHNLDTIAQVLGISRRALGRAFEAQADLKEAFDAGRAALEQELAASLLEKARAGNVTCAIFLLKAQCGWRDTGVADARGPSVAVQINLPAAMTEAAYVKLIEENHGDQAD